MHRLFILLFMICFSSSQAQNPWILQNDNLSTNRMIESYDGGLIVVGAESGSSETGKVIKYDVLGNKLWEHTFEENDEHIRISVTQEDVNGDILIGGVTFQYDSFFGDGFLAKIDACGELVWLRVFEDDGNFDYISEIVIGKDHSVYIHHHIDESSETRYVLKHVDKDGALVWVKQFFTEYGHSVRELIMTKDKGFLMVGTVYTPAYYDQESSLGYLRTGVVRTDSLGNELWTNIFRWEEDVPDSIQYSSGYDIEQCTDSTFLVTALKKGTDEYPIVYELDDEGNLIWYKEYPSDESVYSSPKIVELNESVYLASSYYPMSSDMTEGRFKIWKMDLNGNIEDEYIDENISEYIEDFEVSKDSTSIFLLTGWGGPNLTNLYAVKFNPTSMSLDTLVSEDNNQYDSYCPDGVQELNYFFPELSVEDIVKEEKKQLHIAPNPASDFTYIYFDTPDINCSAKLEIHNMQGALMSSYEIQGAAGRVKEELVMYAKGVYTVSLMVNGRLVESYKMVVE